MILSDKSSSLEKKKAKPLTIGQIKTYIQLIGGTIKSKVVGAKQDVFWYESLSTINEINELINTGLGAYLTEEDYLDLLDIYDHAMYLTSDLNKEEERIRFSIAFEERVKILLKNYKEMFAQVVDSGRNNEMSKMDIIYSLEKYFKMAKEMSKKTLNNARIDLEEKKELILKYNGLVSEIFLLEMFVNQDYSDDLSIEEKTRHLTILNTLFCMLDRLFAAQDLSTIVKINELILIEAQKYRSLCEMNTVSIKK